MTNINLLGPQPSGLSTVRRQGVNAGVADNRNLSEVVRASRVIARPRSQGVERRRRGRGTTDDSEQDKSVERAEVGDV